MATAPAPLDDANSQMDPFTYDYDTLRTIGLVLAICMFVSGIVIALKQPFTQAAVCMHTSSGKKFRCKKSDPSLTDPRAAGKSPTPAGTV